MSGKICLVFLCLCFGPHIHGAFAAHDTNVALVMKALSNPFFITMQEGAKAYAEKHDIPLEVFGIERETEVDRQIGIVEYLIARGAGAIVIAPADSKRLIPVCQKALEHGIAVINIDNPFHKESLQKYGISIPFVGSDNKAGAAMVGKYLARKMGGEGKVIVLEGIRGVENADLRKEGFIEAIMTDSNIEVIASKPANWHTDEAFSLTTELLQQHEHVDAIFCANDNMALGAIQAIEMLGLTGSVWVGSYDNIEEVRVEMRNHSVHATIEQHPELMGAFGVELAALVLAGKPVPEYLATPLDLVTYDSFGKTLGVSLADLSNPFFLSLQRGAQQTAELFGLELHISDAENDDAKQLLALQDFIEDQVDQIILNPTNAETVVPAIEMAAMEHIGTITVDRKSSREELVQCHVASDNFAGGRLAGEFIAERLNRQGTILEIEGVPGTPAAYERGKGFNEVINQYPDLSICAREVANFERQKAAEIMTRLLKDGLAVDAVFAHNDTMILGVLDAIAAYQGNAPEVLVGFDAIDEAIAAVKQKRLTATIAQKPEEMGRQAVLAAVRGFQGESLPEIIFVELELIQ